MEKLAKVDNPFEVYKYSIKALEAVIAEKSNNTLKAIHNKSHINYFESYCGPAGVNVRTFIVENNYVDRDYLEDFAGYYIRCFHPYKRLCARIHFFSNEFCSKDFDELLIGLEEGSLTCEILQEHYLGFVVIKPLPKTVIGRTCLKTYPCNEKRYFPVARIYTANLFGIELKSKTLAFQEQDQTIAACATSALWSVFHCTGMLYQHIIPSPFEITKAATDKFPIETRVLPNNGLTLEMMAHAVQHVGLEPYSVNVSEEYVLKSTLYAYLKARISIVLLLGLYDKKYEKLIGYHAVAVTGYNLGSETATPYGKTGFLLTASHIDKIYVHDDQVGPFAKMTFDGEKVNKKLSLSTSWKSGDGKVGSVRAIPINLLIPLYHKIRIPFEPINDAVIIFDAFVEDLRAFISDLSIAERLKWDIYLTDINELKSETRCLCKARGNYFRDILLEPMPRFLWRATARSQDNNLVLDLLFDATDIERGNFFVRAIEYNDKLSIVLRSAITPKLEEKYDMTAGWQIIQWLKNNQCLD